MIHLNANENQAPIGVFDSGLGGLTVARRIQEELPNERVLYVADQAHVPYGGRELAQVQEFACAISRGLLQAGCKAIVMACNISSATALTTVQEEHAEMPVLGVILPGAQAAAQQTRRGRIGVLATEGTVKSGAYSRAFHTLNPALEVTEVACPEFVPLVECGLERSYDAWRTAQEYLEPLRQAEVDTIVLGCTHYPFLLPTLQKAWEEVDYVDPAIQTVQALREMLAEGNLLAAEYVSRKPIHLLTTTGDADAFAAQLLRFLPDAGEIVQTAQAVWKDKKLLLPECL